MTTTKTVHHFSARNFSAANRRALTKKGITILRSMNLPGEDGSYANGILGYELNDNGTSRIRTHLEVIAIAAQS